MSGALGEVQHVYCSQRNQAAFSLLLTSGVIVLVHPICVDKNVAVSALVLGKCSDSAHRAGSESGWGRVLL